MKDIFKFHKRIIDSIYKVNDVQQGYFFWRNRLISICLDIFEYKNLPESLPEQEILYRLITTGHCSIFRHPEFGLITSNSRLFNFDLYGRFREANVWNPYVNLYATGFNPNSLTIGKDVEVIYLTPVEKYLDQPLQGFDVFMQLINRYARLLADLESTLDIEIVNIRQTYLVTAGSQTIRDSIIDLFRSRKRGEEKVIVDDDILNNVNSHKMHDYVHGKITECQESRDKLIKQFLEEIGIFTVSNKMERIIPEEISQENKNMKIFIYNMLKSQKDGVEKVNKLFGTNISVDLRNDVYDEATLYDEDEYTLERKEAEIIDLKGGDVDVVSE